MVRDSRLRVGLAITVIAVGVATALRLLLQPAPGVPSWAVLLFTVLSVAILALIYTDKQPEDHKAINLENDLFRTRMVFNVSAVAIILTLAVILILALIYGFLA
jgi:SSS family solute:Na+ symporter